MAAWKKIGTRLGVGALIALCAFVVFIGPWPTYGPGFRNQEYFRQSLAALDAANRGAPAGAPGLLKAGWGAADITPPAGVPLAGFGGRKGRPSTGAHDPLKVKALAFHDGRNTVLLFGSDLLLVPDPVAAAVRKAVSAEARIAPNSLLFSASHTHSGPGGLAPGLVARAFAGAYDPRVPELLIRSFTAAALEAVRSLRPAKMAVGSVDAGAFVRNRTRQAEVDPDLQFARIEQENGKICHLVRFSAHPTVLGEDNFQFSADYPGYLQAAIEQATGGMTIYMGGAVGSMSSRGAPGSGFERARALGEQLAQLVLAGSGPGLPFQDRVPVDFIGGNILLPPFQVRILNPGWRISPLLGRLLGIPGYAWIQAVRIGDLVLFGVPGDFSGEISNSWKSWASRRNIALWPTSFCGSYGGYISPDRYYSEMMDSKGNIAYETGLMSWCGPDQEAYFTALMQHMVEAVTGRK